jgi:DnaJ-class molecular chaperone
MAIFKNHYQILDIDTSASPEVIKSAFRKLVRQHHPDVNAGTPSATDRFREINEAYEVLSDPVKRLAFNQLLQAKNHPSASKKPQKTEASNTSTTQASAKQHQQTESGSAPEKNQSAKQAAGSGKASGNPLGDLFTVFLKKNNTSGENTSKEDENHFTKSTQHAQGNPSVKPSEKAIKKQRGKDLTLVLSLSVKEAKQGGVKKVTIPHQEVCQVCSGTGYLNHKKCSGCHGQKSIEHSRKIDVRIPAGVQAGSRIRVSQEGTKGIAGGEAGDLYLQIDLSQEEPIAVNSPPEKETLDVHAQHWIPVPLAVLGGETEVPGPSGKIVMTIPPGTLAGKVFRLKNRGLETKGYKGDYYVTIMLQIPNQLSLREKNLYQELLDLQIR